MALMAFREPNQVKWVGVRPAHRGTQIAADNQGMAGFIIVYTVSAGKTLYLTDWSWAIEATGVGGTGVLAVRDAGDVQLYTLAGGALTVASAISKACGLFFPIEIPADYDIFLWSSAATLNVRAFIHGWEE